MFDGWFDENGNRMQNTQTINADQTYTARFIPIGLSDDNILAMPDARGTVGSDGSGKVSVSGEAPFTLRERADKFEPWAMGKLFLS